MWSKLGQTSIHHKRKKIFSTTFFSVHNNSSGAANPPTSIEGQVVVTSDNLDTKSTEFLTDLTKVLLVHSAFQPKRALVKQQYGLRAPVNIIKHFEVLEVHVLL